MCHRLLPGVFGPSFPELRLCPIYYKRITTQNNPNHDQGYTESNLKIPTPPFGSNEVLIKCKGYKSFNYRTAFTYK